MIGRIQQEEEAKSIASPSAADNIKASLGDWKILAPLSAVFGATAITQEVRKFNI